MQNNNRVWDFELLYESCFCVCYVYPTSRFSLLYIEVWKIRLESYQHNKESFEALINHQWSFVWYGYWPMKDQFQIHSKSEGTLMQADDMLSLRNFYVGKTGCYKSRLKLWSITNDLLPDMVIVLWRINFKSIPSL